MSRHNQLTHFAAKQSLADQKISINLLSYRVEPAELIERNAVVDGCSKVALNVSHMKERTVDTIEGEVSDHSFDVERLIGLADTLA